MVNTGCGEISHRSQQSALLALFFAHMKPSRILSTLFLVAVASGAPVKRSDVNTLQAVNQEPNVTGVFSHPVAYYDPASKLPPLLSADEPAALYKVEPDWGNQFQVSSLDVTATTLTVSNSLVDADTVLDLTTASDPAGRPFKGIGVAFTDSALYELGLLSPEAQDAVMAASFGTSAGNGLSWSRFPIGSCDFSPTLDAPYNYLDGSTGTGLDQFTLTPKNPCTLPPTESGALASRMLAAQTSDDPSCARVCRCVAQTGTPCTSTTQKSRSAGRRSTRRQRRSPPPTVAARSRPLPRRGRPQAGPRVPRVAC